MDNAKAQLVDKLKSANNILVTVSRNPSVDQLAACIGLTLLLNKLTKHTAAVFSGEVPSTLEFLQPEETIEKNTDSLRDFIIALDKKKADKLRYKVEDNLVRIFITPYKTSISQDDLEFSEGDFNVDVVVAIGVRQQEDLDEAITAHGRILHDATVASINTTPDGGLGTINWHEPQASSLSELVTELAEGLGDNLLDEQIATALLTGIVAETDRFSNEKTSSETMSFSAALMAAGANQQLVATKLAEPLTKAPAADTPATAPVDDNGMLEIDHTDVPDEAPPSPSTDGTPPSVPPELPPVVPDVPPDSSGSLASAAVSDAPAISGLSTPQPSGQNPPFSPPGSNPQDVLTSGPKFVSQPPSMGGVLNANTRPEGIDPVTDPLSLPSSEVPQLFDHGTPAASGLPAQPVPSSAPTSSPAFSNPLPPPTPPVNPLPPVAPPVGPAPGPAAPPASTDQPRTLSDLEASVGSPHTDAGGLNAARDQVSRALGGSPDNTDMPEPIQALNAQPMGGDLHPADTPPPPAAPVANASTDPTSPSITIDATGQLSHAPVDGAPPTTPPASPAPTPPLAPVSNDAATTAGAPPPVPPPIPFQFGAPDNSSPQK